jgi:hypothetical protein
MVLTHTFVFKLVLATTDDQHVQVTGVCYQKDLSGKDSGLHHQIISQAMLQATALEHTCVLMKFLQTAVQLIHQM